MSTRENGMGLDEAERRRLIEVATESIRARLERRAPNFDHIERTAAMAAPGASFVTLRHGDRLLGCIGSMTPVSPLIDDVAHNAERAAFADPRLPALTPAEFEVMQVKVSVLSALEPVAVSSASELAGVVRPGTDGLLIESRRHRATFLPSVWEQVPEVAEFLSMLWRKAGIRPFEWPEGLAVWRYHTLEFGDPGPRPPIRA